METVFKWICCTCEIVRNLPMDFPTSGMKKRKGVEHEIQVSKIPTTESPPLEKPTAEGKQKESLVIYFLY